MAASWHMDAVSSAAKSLSPLQRRSEDAVLYCYAFNTPPASGTAMGRISRYRFSDESGHLHTPAA